MILKIDINKFIVYNNDGVLVIMEAYADEDKSKDYNTVDFRLYSNPKNLSEDYIKASLKKTLSLKDRAIIGTKHLVTLKKSPFYKPFSEDISIGDEILCPAYVDDKSLTTKLSEIIKMIEENLIQGELVPGSNEMNGFSVEGCTYSEMSDFLNGFDSLSKKHENTPSKKIR